MLAIIIQRLHLTIIGNGNSYLIAIFRKKAKMAKKAAKDESPAKAETKKSGITKPMKLSSDLAALVGQKQASRAECIKQLWAYLKKNNIQDPDNKQYITPDKKMAKIFGTEKIRGFGMAKFLTSHLSEI